MKEEEKSLQKLTDVEIVKKLLTQEKITVKERDRLTSKQIGILNDESNRIYNRLKTKQEQDAFLDKVEDILDEDSRNHRWQNNHVSIQAAITNLLLDYNRMPSVAEIAQHAKLSRQTVNKHLKNFDTQTLYQQEWDKLRYASVNLMGKVLKEAAMGDIKAARLFFDILGQKPSGNTFIKHEQNNYLTINNLKLDEPTLQSMPKELLQQIEAFVKNKEEKKLEEPLREVQVVE